MTDGVDKDFFEDRGEDGEGDEEEEVDQRLHECHEDMSLMGRPDSGDEGGDAGEALSLDAELPAFNAELHGRGETMKPIRKNVLCVEEIQELGRQVLNIGLDRNGRAKLEQLEMLQELHEAYERGKENGGLSKCLLSMYLKLTAHHRLRLIEDLKRYRDGELEEPPEIPRRMAKLAACFKILADRGFDGDSLSYPHANVVITPEFLGREKDGSSRKQFTLAELERNQKNCELRYTCKVVFSRVTTEKILAGIIPYSALAHIEHAHCWAHAQANLRLPLKMPGVASNIGPDYFES